ncbi:Ig-like domain-containing protein, partial [Moheibacter sediminis]
MNKLYFTVILTLFYTALYAQFEHATWYFGKNAGVSFSSGFPVGITGGQVDTNEGCASISDDCGNLLFYTDGRRVYNRTHSVMQNGYGLSGNSTSTQSAIIVPNPANADQYYIFTIFSISGFYYSVVDMTLDGGNGGLVVGQKNIQIPLLNGYRKSSEKITISRTADCNGYWILTHAENKFYAFKLTDSGLNLTPVISTVGMFVPMVWEGNTIGYLKASPDSKKLAIAHKDITEHGGGLAVYDFDNLTGLVSNEKVLYDPTFPDSRSYYGVEFSPNQQFLYATTGNSLIQYDLNSPNIPQSQKVVSSANIGALQLGPDRKIYHTNYDSYYLSVINKPNELLDPVAGTNPDYVSHGIFLDGGIARFGVPTFTIPYNYKGKIEINSVDNKCEGDNCFQIPLNFEFMGCPDASLVWDFGDGNTSTNQNPIHNYAAIGTYTILLTYTLQVHTYTTTTEITIHPLPVAFDAELEECLDFSGNAEFDLTESLPQISSESDVDITFHELESEAETGTNDLPTIYTTSTNTTLYIRIENENGCYVVRELELIVHPLPAFTVGNPLFQICINSSAELEVTTDAGNTVNWYDSLAGTTPIFTGNPFTTPNLTVTTTYWVEVVSEEGCPGERQEIVVEIVDSITPIFDLELQYCVGNELIDLPTESENGIMGTWSPSQIDTSILGIQTFVFTPDPDQCADEFPFEIEVTDSIEPIFDLESEYCKSDELITLPTQSDNGITGTWTPNQIDTSVAGIQNFM